MTRTNKSAHRTINPRNCPLSHSLALLQELLQARLQGSAKQYARTGCDIAGNPPDARRLNSKDTSRNSSLLIKQAHHSTK
jgi:hypothetical protein